MATQRLQAQITIGGAVKKSLTRGIGIVKSRMYQVGDAVQDVRKKQKELDKSRAELRRQGKSVEHLDREYEQLGDTLERLKTKQAAWQRVAKAQNNVGQAAGNMSQQVGALARRTGIAVGAAAGGIFALANSTATLGDDAAKTADKLGMEIGRLQELRYAAERSGVSTQKFDSSLERFTKRLGEAAQGTGAAKGALEELGLSAQTMASMTPDEALAAVANRLKDVENQSERTAYAADLFGREGVAMVNMLRDGSEGLTKLREDARKTGYVLSDQAARDAEKFKDRLLDAQLALAGMKNTIGAALMPVITDLMGRMSSYMSENRDKVVRFAKAFAGGLRDAVPTIVELSKGVATMAGHIGSALSATAELAGGFKNLGMILGGLFAAKAVMSVLTFAKSLWSLGSAVTALASGLPAVSVGIKAIGAALAANPIGATVMAIAVAAPIVIRYWEPISEFFTNLFSTIWENAKKAWDLLKGLVSWSPLGAMIDAWEPLTSFFGDLWEGVLGKAESALGWIVSKVESVGGAIASMKSFFGFGGDDEEEEKTPDEKRRERLGRGRIPGIVGTARYQTEDPRPGRLQDVEARARYQTEDPRPGRLQDVEARARYQTEDPRPGRLQDVEAKARYRTEQPKTVTLGDAIGRARRAEKAPRYRDVPVQQHQQTTRNETKNVNTDRRTAKTENNWNITINQQPGQDSREIVDEIERRQREKERAALYDQAMAYGY